MMGMTTEGNPTIAATAPGRTLIVRSPEEAARRRAANDRQVALNIRRLHPNMRRLFKVWCAKHEISMEQAVIQLIEGVVSGDLQPNVTPCGHLS